MTTVHEIVLQALRGANLTLEAHNIKAKITIELAFMEFQYFKMDAWAYTNITYDTKYNREPIYTFEGRHVVRRMT